MLLLKIVGEALIIITKSAVFTLAFADIVVAGIVIFYHGRTWNTSNDSSVQSLSRK